MGLKLSCIHRGSLSRQVSLSPAPARVIAADGSLNEVHGASVSDVLSGDAAASPSLSFVCNSDALYFNESPPALGHGEPLQPGQIYFVLPAAMLGRPLSSADMAALAVRASAALTSGSKRRRRRGRGRNGSKNKTKVRVMPVLSGDAAPEDVDFVNEKLNEQTLGQFRVLPISPARNSSNQKLAATEAPSGLKRALSVIREDAM
ncbi:hypothetical protein QOZ80_2AG0104740 [Eleusine coracana subsp. coracana]|nr:hypothetical protein QOZ80_2AG0104740 [Eleusine coracana subsp. coracana]